MSARARESGLWALAAAGATALVAWIGLAEFGWSDYEHEASASVAALLHGHLSAFFALAPAYGGSLLERAPFALAPRLWGGGELAAFRMLAAPCLLAALAFGLWLVSWMRRERHSRLARGIALGLCVASPLTLAAVEIGHPEELLGGVLCVLAVLLAADGKAAWAGIVLGAAVANKQWALLAVGPVLVALPRRRVLCLLIAGGACAALLAPFLAFGLGHFTASESGAATNAGESFAPWQVWWFLGHANDTGHVLAGTHAATAAQIAEERIAPGWVAAASHPLIVGLTLPASIGASMARRRSPAPPDTDTTSRDEPASRVKSRRHRWVGGYVDGADALLLLALLLLLRCMLDPWDNIYYPIPFLLALLTWETRTWRRPPWLALAAMLAVFFDSGEAMVPGWSQLIEGPDATAAFFLAWTVPLAVFFALRLYRRPQSRTVSSSDSKLRLRAPSAASSSRSSILTPSSPGR